ncbi:hypothetical protein PsYK624_053510 [Phanerochaete sordida]|uniref:F-box domain-containing protein n=1 Tax=Phanerochaete sordida TaxID=48140 RepID=A0A9P3G7I7_9APHY|nr:hypothetical protein PsYK624_053510 [Phanerochaete sordida]
MSPLSKLRSKLDSKAPNPRSRSTNHEHVRPPNYTRMFGELRWKGDTGTPQRAFPISRLPPELLAEVFYWHILTVYATDYSSHTSPSAYCWLVIRHVCHAWRAVALGFPKLSSHIAPIRPRCVRDLLARSGGVPLYIYERQTTASGAAEEARRLVLAHFDRIVYMELSSFDVLLGLTPPSSPVDPPIPRTVSPMRTLAFRGLSSQFSAVAPVCGLYDFPQLEVLNWRWRGLAAAQHLLVPSLRSLSLSSCLQPLEIDDFLGLLRRLDALEALELRDLFKERADDPAAAVATEIAAGAVHLPHLRTLTIEDNHGSVLAHVLGHLAIPATAAVSLSTRTVPADPALLAAIAHNATAHLHGAPAPIQALTVAQMSRWDPAAVRLDVRAWPAPLPLDALWACHGGVCPAPAHFSFTCNAASAPFVEALLAEMPLGGVRSALLAEPFVRGCVRWGDVLGRLEGVRDLGLSYDTCAATHTQVTEEVMTDGIGEGRFPRLQSLRRWEDKYGGSWSLNRERVPSELQRLAHRLDARITESKSLNQLTYSQDREESEEIPGAEPRGEDTTQAGAAHLLDKPTIVVKNSAMIEPAESSASKPKVGKWIARRIARVHNLVGRST